MKAKKLLPFLPLLLWPAACGEGGPPDSEVVEQQSSVVTTPLDLELWDPGQLGNEARFAGRITNRSTGQIQLSKLKIKAWIRETDSIVPATYASNSSTYNSSGNWIANVGAPSVSVASVSPEKTCSASRKANKVITVSFADTVSIPAGGWMATNSDTNSLFTFHRPSWGALNRGDDYSKIEDASSTSAGRDNLPEFALYLDGGIVCETLSGQVADGNTGKEPCYVDQCSQPPPGTGGTSGSGGSGGAGGGIGGGAAGTAGTAGASGGTSGGTGGSTGGTSGSGGSSGAGTGGTGATGGTPALAYSFHIDTAKGVAPSDVVLGSYAGFLKVRDKVDLLLESGPGFSSTSSVDDAFPVLFGPHADAQNAWAATTAGVSLGSNARIHGSIESEGPVSVAPGAIIDGTTNQAAELHPFEHRSWTVTFPPTITNPTTVVNAFQTVTAAPEDRFGNVTVKSNGRLKLQARTFFDKLTVEPNGKLELLNSPNAVLTFIRGDFNFSGILIEAAPTPNVLFALASTPIAPADADIVAPFRGTVVSPFGQITLRACGPGHVGSFFAKKIEAEHSFFQTTPIKHRPVDFPAMCSALPAGEQGVCSVFCPCEDGECQQDSDCKDGWFCPDQPNGWDVGEDPTRRFCQIDDCLHFQRATGCGQADDPCGLSCTDHQPCDPFDPSCPPGTLCEFGNGLDLGSAFASVCWDEICAGPHGEDPALGECGDLSSRCGLCRCQPSCDDNACGERDDACGGTCAGTCIDREPGCQSDLDCQPGSACILGGGPRIGLPSVTNVCLPVRCLADPLPQDCGGTSAICGVCEGCEPNCTGRECGTDPDCGVECGPSCAPGSFCSEAGHCELAPSTPSILAPDGAGGLVPVEPLAPAATTGAGMALPGSFAVSDDGKPTYRIPIDVPPGRAGIEPVLSLLYDGSRTNGDLGVGWRLDGLSSVSPCNPSQALDAKVELVAPFETPSGLCIDGKRMHLVADLGDDRFEYRTVIDSFSKIVVDAPEGIDNITVWTKDGRVLEYGETPDSRVGRAGNPHTAYGLNEVRDRSGNTMSIHYAPQGDGRPLHVAWIGYTGHGDAEGDRRVEFRYEDRTDVTSGYGQAGILLERRQRLKAIQTFVASTPVRRYDITYGAAPHHGASQITEVTACVPSTPGSTPEECAEPTRFDYYDDGIGYEYATSTNIGPTGVWVDLNGDALPDLLRTEAKLHDSHKTAREGFDVGVNVAATAASFAGPEAGAVGAFANFAYNVFVEERLFGSPSYGIENSVVLGAFPLPFGENPAAFDPGGLHCGGAGVGMITDHDGDGDDDILELCSNNVDPIAVDVRLAEAAGNGHFTQRGALFTLPRWSKNTLAYDMNGDGLQDILRCFSPNLGGNWHRYSLRDPATGAFVPGPESNSVSCELSIPPRRILMALRRKQGKHETMQHVA